MHKQVLFHQVPNQTRMLHGFFSRARGATILYSHYDDRRDSKFFQGERNATAALTLRLKEESV